MSSGIIIWILAAHFVADFLLQADWMAQGKSKRWAPLLWHILVYTIALGFLGPVSIVDGVITPPLAASWLWVLTNGTAHLVIDYFTSRASSRLFAAKQIHWAFVVIGFDQLLHTALLVGTWEVLS